jgi:hypothetical protein
MQGEDSFRRYLRGSFFERGAAGGFAGQPVRVFLKERQRGKQLDEANPDDLRPWSIDRKPAKELG